MSALAVHEWVAFGMFESQLAGMIFKFVLTSSLFIGSALFLASCATASDPTSDADRIFAILDRNNDESVSYEEFENRPWYPGRQKREEGMDAEEMFRRMDRNGDGIVSRSEIPR